MILESRQNIHGPEIDDNGVMIPSDAFFNRSALT